MHRSTISLFGTLIMEALSLVKFGKWPPDCRQIEDLTHRSAFATDFSHSLFSEVGDADIELQLF